MNRQINKKLGRAISGGPEVYSLWTFEAPKDEMSYVLVRAEASRQEAFDYLHGRDVATARKTREEKLDIIRKKLYADVELMLKAAEENDSWLDDLYRARKHNLSTLPRQH